jgi:phosphoribosylformylglycinamidine synthase
VTDTISDSNSQQTSTASKNSPSSSGESIWQIDLFPTAGMPDRLAEEILSDAQDLGLPADMKVKAARSFLLQGNLTEATARDIAKNLLVEPVVEHCVVAEIGSDTLSQIPSGYELLVNVMPLPGVTDPQAESAHEAIQNLGFNVSAVRTLKRYWVSAIQESHRETLFKKLLCNESIETVVVGPLELDRLDLGREYEFVKTVVPIRDLDDEALFEISKQWQLSLSLVEMQTIKAHFNSLDRDPTDVELETIAQTWSEHCSHKTLAGRIHYRDENGTIEFDNMLKETIFAATVQIREDLGDDDWCVSVFKDNAGIVTFDDKNNVAFKVETHNRPSALEPYGGANTGIGGVIRDTLGTGMGAKPVCNTDVFCFADPSTPFEELPPGVMHPRRIMKGVVSGVRDYGNRMGIPTVNGAVYFDKRYVGNPLVFCGNVGILPKEMSFKEPQPNDLIVSIGGKTGRDGIHGATFSSAELTESSDITSGGAVQIGNAITEKMLMDVLLKARDLELYTPVTDCGAGGYSSAVGEMGEEIGAEVWLDKVPLKYDGLSYTEIWISEAQERMVFSVPESKWKKFEAICAAESVVATVIGKFTPTGNLKLIYADEVVSDVSMAFLHDGRPPVVREATFAVRADLQTTVDASAVSCANFGDNLCAILGSLNVASKHWVIRQYDHEVQGGSVIKPLVGADNDGPGDAAVVRPVLDSRRGLVIGCGMNPHFGDIDPYHMATSSIDEAIRNCVAVGADPKKIAILDNFCWGHTDRPETLGSLVRAALGCRDLSIKYQTPFISGKDSLHNEFSFNDDSGARQTISIPSTLLISAMGQVEDVKTCTTMDLKASGNVLYQIGVTKDELGGSHWSLVTETVGGDVPQVDAESAMTTFIALHHAIESGLVRSCHDISEGGLAAAIAEMAFAGGLGAEVDVSSIDVSNLSNDLELVRLFSESNSRFVVEVTTDNEAAFESAMSDVAIAKLGSVNDSGTLTVRSADNVLISEPIAKLKSVWQSPLDL